MSEHDLPEDLMALERALAGGPEAEGPFIDRVMLRVKVHQSNELSLWQFAGALAAVVILGAMLLVSLTQGKSVPRMGVNEQSIVRISSQIDRLQLGLSPEEIRKIVVPALAARDMPRIPSPMNPDSGYSQRTKEYHKLMGD